MSIRTLTPEQKIVQRIDALFIVHGWDRGEVYKDGCSRYECLGLQAILNPLRFLVTFKTGNFQTVYGLAKEQAAVEEFIITKDRPLTPPIVFKLFRSVAQQKALEAEVNRDYEISLVMRAHPHDSDPLQLSLDELRAVRQEITGVIVYIEESQRSKFAVGEA